MSEPIAVIDVDTHLTEPADLWTSRLPKKYKEDAPHLVWDPERARDRWQVGRHTLIGVQDQAHAGWKELHDNAARLYRIDTASATNGKGGTCDDNE